MKITLSLKVRLLPDQVQADKFRELTQVYAAACTYLSRYAFESGIMTDNIALHNRKYQEIRGGFAMKAQLAQSVIKTVTARYKSLRKQLREEPYRIWDKESDKTYSFQRDLNWLQKPILFSRPQADLVRNRDWSFAKLKDGTPCLSIASMRGREKVRFVSRDFCRYLFDPSWKFGTGKLIRSGGKWYLHVSVTKKVPDVVMEEVEHIVGIDRGIKSVIAYGDETGATGSVSGAWIQHVRRNYALIRASLQSKGTKGAKRVLKRLSRRENGFMADVNHQLSKALCKQYPSATLFVLEDLTGISFSPKNLHGGQQSLELRSWAFYDLEQKLSYKAALCGNLTIKVDPYMTSQRCPHCGNFCKDARQKDQKLYICPECGYEGDDDETAALNLVYLGQQYHAGDPEPSFRNNIQPDTGAQVNRPETATN